MKLYEYTAHQLAALMTKGELSAVESVSYTHLQHAGTAVISICRKNIALLLI